MAHFKRLVAEDYDRSLHWRRRVTILAYVMMLGGTIGLGIGVAGVVKLTFDAIEALQQHAIERRRDVSGDIGIDTTKTVWNGKRGYDYVIRNDPDGVTPVDTSPSQSGVGIRYTKHEAETAPYPERMIDAECLPYVIRALLELYFERQLGQPLEGIEKNLLTRT